MQYLKDKEFYITWLINYKLLSFLLKFLFEYERHGPAKRS